ncbi:Rieske Fe-S protein [Kitasatospora gansuensis]|uniref:Cytochrome bc1 complex Rieske iron-sulfur subunit n=1 Tax=Kitasatospora gansuensis TaxID=258050 RepID=A0A7W7SBJ3_9ACTN|nr:Rieske (2Fe-2S) protein [Kitasatospora gansuensis]MBB4946376.1 Rieske Fe-S protein [Kitasatospora gansuensis]
MTDTTPAPSRRTLLCCGAALAAGGAAVAVTGCGSSTSSDSGSGGAAAAPVTVGAVADVPVGGGKVYREAKIVVTQPTAGEYKAFSAKCTHAGCVVDEVKDGTVNCPCHYSKFAVADGSVKDGPAPSPLPAYRVTVKDGAFEVTK